MSIVLHITLLGNPAVTLLSGGHPDVGDFQAMHDGFHPLSPDTRLLVELSTPSSTQRRFSDSASMARVIPRAFGSDTLPHVGPFLPLTPTPLPRSGICGSFPLLQASSSRPPPPPPPTQAMFWLALPMTCLGVFFFHGAFARVSPSGGFVPPLSPPPYLELSPPPTGRSDSAARGFFSFTEPSGFSCFWGPSGPLTSSFVPALPETLCPPL
ncbi:hypothetical protein CJ030_MR3G024000 [Morella rubra]|uniref:Uncharacterized protein n=1 Tax=Morella rubra TaxID=262757 RepID=A0A6A1W6I2_9ROSI|nr:hypothetical protein CJ030_MR3G024000 [Morella rubra]